MKKLLTYLIPLIVTAGCGDEEFLPNTESKIESKSELDTIEDNIVFNKTQIDTLYEEEYLGENLNKIRKLFTPFLSINGWTSMDKRLIKNENDYALYYFYGGILNKIRFIQNKTDSSIYTEFYLNNDSLIFVYEKQIDSLELKKNYGDYEMVEDSMFFENGKLIRIKSNMDCGAPFSPEYLLEEQNRLKSKFELMIKRLGYKRK